jgi:hypothetical protein
MPAQRFEGRCYGPNSKFTSVLALNNIDGNGDAMIVHTNPHPEWTFSRTLNPASAQAYICRRDAYRRTCTYVWHRGTSRYWSNVSPYQSRVPGYYPYGPDTFLGAGARREVIL